MTPTCSSRFGVNEDLSQNGWSAAQRHAQTKGSSGGGEAKNSARSWLSSAADDPGCDWSTTLCPVDDVVRTIFAVVRKNVDSCRFDAVEKRQNL